MRGTAIRIGESIPVKLGISPALAFAYNPFTSRLMAGTKRRCQAAARFASRKTSSSCASVIGEGASTWFA